MVLGFKKKSIEKEFYNSVIFKNGLQRKQKK